MKSINITQGLREQDILPIHDLLKKDTLFGYGTYENREEGQAYMLEISSEEKIKEWVNDIVVTIYNEDNFLIGFGRAKHDCWITHVFVDEAYQKQGYGKVILELLENNLLKLGCKEIHLTSEPKVVVFYKTYGWSAEQNEPINYHGMLLVPMKKILG